jgi:cobalt/nickel transport system permease protein
MEIPRWMLDRIDPEPSSQPDNGKYNKAFSLFRGRNAVRKAASGLASLLEEMLTDEKIAGWKGFLQSINARAKVIGLLGLLIVATLLHRLPGLAIAYGMCILLAWLSYIPSRRILRAWMVIPLFSALIVLPAVFNIVTPGDPIVTLWNFNNANFGSLSLPPALTITDSGIYVASRFVLRILVCVSLALLLTTTTRANQLMRGLRALGVPQLFVMLLSMMHRYLNILMRTAEEIHLARISRSIAIGTLHQEQSWVAAGMGELFRRTHSLGDTVYRAMISRGYTGEIYLLDDPRWQLTDWAFLMIVAGFSAVMLVFG